MEKHASSFAGVPVRSVAPEPADEVSHQRGVRIGRMDWEIR